MVSKNEKKEVCMDYDSMGDYSRFSNKKESKSITLVERVIKLFKRKPKSNMITNNIMVNKNGTTELLREHNEDDRLIYLFNSLSDKYHFEYTFDDKGKELTYRNSDGFYRIKDKIVTKEEYDELVKQKG